MEKKPSLHFLNNPKHYAFLVGFGIACIHFAITYFSFGPISDGMQSWCMQAVSDDLDIIAENVALRCNMIIGFILFAPSYILILYANFRLDSNIIPFILATSLFYGSVASFLVSKNIILRVVGVVLIICLFCATGFGIMAVLSYSDA